MNAIPFIERCVRVLIATICLPLTIIQTVISAISARQNKPTGEQVPIGSGAGQLHVHITGTGGPTVILESGMGSFSLDWSFVQPELSSYATVLSYDRAGFGWSNRTLSMPTCQQYVDDLRVLLHAKQLKPPYVLVGHSYGGMIMRLFASQYPEEVAGLVMVDAAHENRFLRAEMGDEGLIRKQSSRKLLRLGYLLSPIVIPRLMSRHIGSRHMPPSILKRIKERGYQNGSYKAAYAEMLCTEISAEQLRAAAPLPVDMPVIVMIAGRQNEEWKRGQQSLLNLSERVTQITVEDSWHSIQIHRPDTVVSAVRSLLLLPRHNS